MQVTASTGGRAIFNNSTGTVTVSGDGVVTSKNATATSGTIYLYAGTAGNTVLDILGGTVENTSTGNAIYNNASGAVSVSGGTVKNSGSGGIAINNHSTGAVTVSDGTVQAGSTAIYNGNTGLITIKSGATVTSPGGVYPTISLQNGTPGSTILDIQGGTVSNTSTGNAVSNFATGTVAVSGGTVQNTGAGMCIRNYSTGDVIVSGGTVQANSDSAIFNASTGKITVTNTATVTSAISGSTSGTIYLYAGANTDSVLSITDGTVSNTNGGNVIYNNASGIVAIDASATITGGIYPLTATPATATASVAKTTSTQASVTFTLSNDASYSANTIWYVYDAATGTAITSGVTAALSGSTLTLSHATNVPAATYYVAAYNRTTGLGISNRLALTVTNPVVPAPTTTVTGASLSADTGMSTSDWITNTQSQTISGTLSAALVAGEKVEVSYDGGWTWSNAATYAVGSNTWSTTTTLSGNSTFMARVANAEGSSTAYTHTYTLDTTAPNITAVSGPANATYTSGQNLEFTVSFDETVTVTTGGGTPSLTLTIGSTTRYATYYSASNATTLRFHYTIQSSDIDSDGIAVITPLSCNGGTIQDIAGNNAVLNLIGIGDMTGVLVSNVAPTVTTQAVTDITSATATGNGNITNLGSSNPTAYGVCWSTNANPTTADSKTNNGATSSTGAFTSSMTGLSASTTYHVRSYATNASGTSYGTDVSFTTSAPPSGGGGGGGDYYTPPAPVTRIDNGGSTTGANLGRLVTEEKPLTVEDKSGAKLVFDTDALKGIGGQTSGDIKVDMKDVSPSYQENLPGKQVFSLTVSSGSDTISNFGGLVTVTLPYELKEGETADMVTVWYLASDGTMTEIPAPTTPRPSSRHLMSRTSPSMLLA